jgi:RNA polymerase sigma-70 factor, ECF subfamily
MSRVGSTNGGKAYRRAELTDSEITECLRKVSQDNDEDAFGLITAYAAPRLKSMLLSQGETERSAEKIVQESMLAVCRRDAGLPTSRSDLLSAVFQAARRVRMRGQGDRDIAGADTPPSPACEASPDGVHGTGGHRSTAPKSKALANLPPDQQKVVKLLFIEALSPREIAARLGLPIKTIKSQMRVACQNLCSAPEMPGGNNAMMK